MEAWFLLSYKEFAFFTKKHLKVTTLHQVLGGNTLSLVLKRIVGHFLKIQPIKEILEFEDWKRGYETYARKKISNQKLINYQKFTRWTLLTRKQTSKRC